MGTKLTQQERVQARQAVRPHEAIRRREQMSQKRRAIEQELYPQSALLAVAYRRAVRSLRVSLPPKVQLLQVQSSLVPRNTKSSQTARTFASHSKDRRKLSVPHRRKSQLSP